MICTYVYLHGYRRRTGAVQQGFCKSRWDYRLIWPCLGISLMLNLIDISMDHKQLQRRSMAPVWQQPYRLRDHTTYGTNNPQL
jgi:hypothetical protein